jgi:hypothetical protein
METIKKDEKRPGQRQVGSNLYVNKTRRNIMKTKILAIVAILAMALMAAPASAALSASANFSIVSGDLQVILTNTSPDDVLVPSQVLTALFFSLPGGVTIAPLSALLSGGSTVFYDPDGQPPGGVVGGEWAYGAGLAGAPNGATNGISSAGFGLFGDANFPGANLAGPDAVDGLQYGILSAGDNTATGNGGITGSDGLIKNQVSFLLDITAGSLNPADITDISFQYGTALTDTNIVPIPPSALLMGSGLLGLGLVGWRRRSHKA